MLRVIPVMLYGGIKVYDEAFNWLSSQTCAFELVQDHRGHFMCLIHKENMKKTDTKQVKVMIIPPLYGGNFLIRETQN